MSMIKKNNEKYNYYQFEPTGQLVAVGFEESKKISTLYKKHKKAEKISSNEEVEGFLFVLDEEFDSLKIDFSAKNKFKVNQLIKAAIK